MMLINEEHQWRIVSEFEIFSVRPLWSLCLCGDQSQIKIHHRDTETTEDAQRKLK